MAPLIEQGLQAIHQRINATDFASHDTDRDAVVDMLVRLHQHGEPLRTLEIEEWAIEHGWHRHDARCLGEVAFQIAQGDAPSYKKTWPDNILERLSASST